MKSRWAFRPVEKTGVVHRLRKELNDLPESLARALVVRGIESLNAARTFFRPNRADLHDPFAMAGMTRAAARVAEAIEGGERVLVYGDYDVDGTCSTALMMHFLRAQGAAADYFIPDRYEHGYGLCEAGIDQAVEQGAALIVALDCGITAHAEAAYVHEKGLDLVICDHHTPDVSEDEAVPDAHAVLDPKRPGCGYPFKELCGCGVGFKLAQATLDRLGRDPEEAFTYLDLVGIATAADIVELSNENRILMYAGLEALRSRPRPGLRALMQASGIEPSKVTTTGQIVFRLAPRINAAGRMAHAREAVELLLAETPREAAARAETLGALNEKRRAIQRAMVDEAVALAERQITSRTPHALVLHRPDWHLGVLGIVASKLVDRFHKPTVLLGGKGPDVSGSARSIRGFNIYDALSACGDQLLQFGGHDHAAGMTLRERDVPAFRDAFDAAVGEALTPDLLTPAIKIDAALDLSAVGGIRDRFWAVLKQFGPFGPSNRRPVFHGEKLAVAGRPRTVGKGDDHLQFRVRPFAANGSGRAWPVIGWRMGDRLSVVERAEREEVPLELLFAIKENEYRGRVSLQLEARDLRLSG